MRRALGERFEEENLEQETGVMNRISGKVLWHVAPIVMLAHSRTNLAAKSRVFLHTLALLAGNRDALLELCKSVCNFHTDYGTEKGLARLKTYR